MQTIITVRSVQNIMRCKYTSCLYREYERCPSSDCMNSPTKTHTYTTESLLEK